MMLLSAATALVRDRGSYLALRRFAFLLNALVTVGMLTLGRPGGLPLRRRDAHRTAARHLAPRPAIDGDPARVAGGHRVPAFLPGHPRQPSPHAPGRLRHGRQARIDVADGGGPRDEERASGRDDRRGRPDDGRRVRGALPAGSWRGTSVRIAAAAMPDDRRRASAQSRGSTTRWR